MQFNDLLEGKKGLFSKSDQKIYTYLIQDLSILETYTITKIAQKAQVSTSAVLRFCQTLGYKGFKDFKYDAVDYLRHQKKEPQADGLAAFSHAYNLALQQFAFLNQEKVLNLAQALIEAPTIYVMGIYYSSLPARYLQMGLMDLGLTSQIASDTTSANHMANLINSEDAVLVFSIEGGISKFSSALSAIKDNMPDKSFLITQNPNAKAASLVSDCLVLPGNQMSHLAIPDSQSMAMIFVDYLLMVLHDQLQSVD